MAHKCALPVLLAADHQPGTGIDKDFHSHFLRTVGRPVGEVSASLVLLIHVGVQDGEVVENAREAGYYNLGVAFVAKVN